MRSDRLADRVESVQNEANRKLNRLDGIVDWLACIDDFSPDVTNIEVRSSHVGMGLDPDVWQILADALAA